MVLVVLVAAIFAPDFGAAQERSELQKYLSTVNPSDLVPDADAFGPIREDLPVASVMSNGQTIGWAFVTTDFVGTTGYSGKPIDIFAVASPDAVLTGAILGKHSEPIVLIGIPESQMRESIAGYVGTDLKMEMAERGSSHDLDIISGATVTVVVIEDSVIRAGLKVARALGLGGLTPPTEPTGPTRELDTEIVEDRNWNELAGDGSVRRLTLDVGQVNSAFVDLGDRRAIDRPEPGAPSDVYIDLVAALVSAPSIGRSLLGAAEYGNLTEWLDEGDHAVLIAGRGRYSFKGSGYVRGGIFDRISVLQGDTTLRFRDRMHRRLGEIAATGTPEFDEIDLFRIPASGEFDPAEPWDLQLLVQRAVGPVDKAFLTFDLGYRLPDRYLRIVPPTSPVGDEVTEAEDEAAAKAALWKRIWFDRRFEITGLLAMLTVLTGVFFFQSPVTRNARAFYWFRIGFLTLTLCYLGWYANAQLSIVNLMALAGAMQAGFTWDAFLLDPMIFILWFSVAVALIFWGRGAYCGWLCPFGALQELSNQIARFFKAPQIELPWGLHERLWPIKYLIFLGLFGVSLGSIPLAEQYAEVEPFKTAIVLKFQRSWPFVLFALAMLLPGLVIERFYCRYLCPLGGALAIPARIRMFDWLKRYRECGNPCMTCANECPVDAIHPTGEINPNECINCLHCQMLYRSEAKCPVIIKQLKRRQSMQTRTGGSADTMERLLKPETGA
ncbi:MAG: 4Fe-4S binding protein [Boseongicola sp.]